MAKLRTGIQRESAQGGARARRPGKAADGHIASVFFRVRFGVLDDPRHDLLLTLVLFAVIIGSRIAAFPASIWEQDEAYLSLGVQSFQPMINHPHPPWFPLWLLLGRVVSSLGIEASLSLRLLSAFFASWLFLPLTAMWSRLMGIRRAVLSALLFLFLPGTWLLSGRAFSGTAATALLIAALAVWSGPGDEKKSTRSLVGSLAALAAILIRPHVLPIAAAALILLLYQKRIEFRGSVLPLLGGGILSLFFLSLVSGGMQPLLRSLIEHGSYHFSRLPEATFTPASFGLSRYLGSGILTGLWVALTVLGMIRALGGDAGDSARVVSVALLTILLEVLFLANPAHARYFIPIVALSAGFVFLGLAPLGDRLSILAVLAGILASVLVVIPSLPEYRSEISPALRAVRCAVDIAIRENRILVTDRRLIAFIDFVKEERSAFPPLLYSFQIRDGMAPPPPPSHSLALRVGDGDDLILKSGEIQNFSYRSSLIRHISQERFLDLRIEIDPVFRGWKTTGKPYIILGP